MPTAKNGAEFSPPGLDSQGVQCLPHIAGTRMDGLFATPGKPGQSGD